MAPMKRKAYEEHLDEMQPELNNLVHWLRHAKRRMVVVLEGRDAAGKGGVINAITERLNPRQVRVVALTAPTEREQSQWYFQRYLAHLPGVGELVLFDRSWYNRAGVERVMGFCTEAQYRAFLEDAPKVEKMLVDDGLLLYKYWLSADQAEQEARFAERAADPLKRWKLSPIDLAARHKYREYGQARDAMFRATHTPHAPWTVVSFDDQRRGRLNLIRHWLDHVPDVRVADTPLRLPPLEKKLAKERFSGPVRPISGPY